VILTFVESTASLHPGFDECQTRCVSNPGTDEPACCTPMVTEPLTESGAADLARGFKALGDPARLRLLSMIAARAGDEVCVCELTDAFTQSGPTISHHLKVLRDAGLVSSERRGSWVYYRVVPSTLAALSALLDPTAMTAGAGA
jgi:ArsR family transcriptional regulator, arsenate/arsenite/antimonite-responsive transcriptional repressor